jgi:hypothetical protein
MFKIAGSWLTLCSDEGYNVWGRQGLLSHFAIQKSMSQLEDMRNRYRWQWWTLRRSHISKANGNIDMKTMGEQYVGWTDRFETKGGLL